VFMRADDLIPARANSAMASPKVMPLRVASARATRKFTVVRMITTVAFQLLKPEAQDEPERSGAAGLENRGQTAAWAAGA
jgi:hypothetical protein